MAEIELDDLDTAGVPGALPPLAVCQQARLSRDPRFDGRFFVGVLTTGLRVSEEEETEGESSHSWPPFQRSMSRVAMRLASGSRSPRSSGSSSRRSCPR